MEVVIPPADTGGHPNSWESLLQTAGAEQWWATDFQRQLLIPCQMRWSKEDKSGLPIH